MDAVVWGHGLYERAGQTKITNAPHALLNSRGDISRGARGHVQTVTYFN